MPKIQYYIDHRKQREAQILGLLESNKNTWYTEMDLVKIIYTETPQQLWEAAAHNVKQHLKKLEKDHKVQCQKIDLPSSSKWKYLVD